MAGTSKKDLWLALRDYHFDHLVTPNVFAHVAHMFGGADASTKAFASKLSRKLGWPRPFALRAIVEYKKFVFLGVSSRFVVTPSKVIDQVWHEHLLFTRAYGEFCREVLGTTFDHNPELVETEDQTGAFQAQYYQTLELYRQEFGHEPPADIWAVPKFKNASDRTARETRQRIVDDGAGVASSSDAPLFAMFADDSHGTPGHIFDGFGGGSSGGGGASHGWSSDHAVLGLSDTGSSEASGSDAGGGSGCSSSCGSGCGGGGGGD